MGSSEVMHSDYEHSLHSPPHCRHRTLIITVPDLYFPCSQQCHLMNEIKKSYLEQDIIVEDHFIAVSECHALTVSCPQSSVNQEI